MASAEQFSIPTTILLSACAASWGEFCTIPLDTAKVRLQTQGMTGGAKAAGDAAKAALKPKYNGLFGTMGTIAKEEGAAALWKGLVPGFHRQVVFGGLRIGLYDHVKNFYVGKDHTGPVPMHMKIAAGLTTGAFAITVASPTDLVKVRMQTQKAAADGSLKYKSALSAYRTIVKEEGVLGLWTGLGPNVGRNAVINAVELATYDTCKEMLMTTFGLPDARTTDMLAGLGAGFLAVCVGSPLDVVKSRMMGAPPGTYSGMANAFYKTLTQEGPLAFYKGFVPNFARIGSWNVVMFVTLGWLKSEWVKHRDG